MLDPKPRGEMNGMVMDAMQTTSWKFWVVAGFLGLDRAYLSGHFLGIFDC